MLQEFCWTQASMPGKVAQRKQELHQLEEVASHPGTPSHLGNQASSYP